MNRVAHESAVSRIREQAPGLGPLEVLALIELLIQIARLFFRDPGELASWVRAEDAPWGLRWFVRRARLARLRGEAARRWDGDDDDRWTAAHAVANEAATLTPARAAALFRESSGEPPPTRPAVILPPVPPLEGPAV